MNSGHLIIGKMNIMHFHLSVILLTPIFFSSFAGYCCKHESPTSQGSSPWGSQEWDYSRSSTSEADTKKERLSRLVDGNSHKINLPDRSAKRRKEETKKLGASDVDQRPMFERLWATTMTCTPAAYLRPMVRSSNKMMKQVIPMVSLNTVRDYQASEANKIRSINVLYSGGLISKEKYKATQLALAFKPNKPGILLWRK